MCSFTYNRICALRVDYCAERNDTTGQDAILKYDQQMFTSDDLENNNFVDGKYRAPMTGQYSANFWTKGFTSDGTLELYHNDRKIEWDQEMVNDHYNADVRLSAGDSLYIMVSGMEDCWADKGAWHLLNSIFCVEPILKVYHPSSDGVWSMWGSWSSCNLKTGKKQRTRQCSNPTSSSEPAECAGSNKDETKCQGDKTEVFLRPGNITISRNNKIGALKNFGMTFVVSFKLFLNKLPTDIRWTNILHFSTGQDRTNYGDRTPGIWLDSGVRFYVASAINGNIYTREYMDLDVAENKWYDFEISQLPDGYGKYVFSCKIDDTVYWKIENEQPRNFEDVIMYIGDPWWEAVQGLVQGLTVKSIDCGESCL